MTQRPRTDDPAAGAQAGAAPEHKVHYGRMDVAVWRRQAEDGRAWYSFTVSRSYKDRDDKWQRTSSTRKISSPPRGPWSGPTTGSSSSDRRHATAASRTSAARPPRD